MSGGRREIPPNLAGAEVDNPVAAVAQTLRELGAHLDEWAVAGAVPPGDAPFGGSAFGDTAIGGRPDGSHDGRLGGSDSSLLAALAVDAVIDTNDTVRQRSLRDFLR